MAGETIGLGAKFFVSADSIGDTPTWTELDTVSEVNLNDERNEALVKDRRSEFEKILLGQRKVSLDLTLTHVKGDAAQTIIRNAYYAKSDIGVAYMTGPIEGVGSGGEEGIMFDAKVASHSMPQPFEDVMTITVKLSISAESAEEPELVIVAGTA